MNCHAAPLDDILSIVRKFWWGKSCDASALCWKSWDYMCTPKEFGGMGFKDLRISNSALLAKQGWRIMMNPDSLLAKVFKARDFPKSDFMAAKLGSKPSYLWRSFLAGREVLNLGIRSQIGTGEVVNVWDENWIPVPYTFRPLQFNRHLHPNACVKDLILPGSNGWNLQLLSDLFLPHEVQAISQIPLSVETMQDRIVWHHSSNGLYTVKSGYSTLQRFRQSLMGDSSRSNINSDKSVWCRLWALRCQPKIKHFIWRAMHNILPVGSNLMSRLSISVVCPHCGTLNETDKHLFYECPYSRRIWQAVGLSYLWLHPSASSFASLMSYILTESGKTTACLFANTAWLLWKSRCCKHFKHHEMSAECLISTATSMTQEYEELQCAANATGQYHVSHWFRPPIGSYSINVDAGITEDGCSGYGVIIRDSEGRIIAAESGPMSRYIHIEHAELQAILQGILLARSLKLQNVQLATDSLLSYNRIVSKQPDFSLLSPMVHQIKRASACFESVSYLFVKREGNFPAHLLASLGRSMVAIKCWDKLPPHDVISAVLLDNVVSNE